MRTMEGKGHNPGHSPVIGKSTSLSTNLNEPGDPAVIDHSQIMILTQDVKNFSDTLAKLKLLFLEGLGKVLLSLTFLSMYLLLIV